MPMKTHIKSLFLLFLIFVQVDAALASQPLLAGARQAGMAGSGVAITDFWSIFHNQAAMVFETRPSVGIGFENRYLTPRLNLGALAVVIPREYGSWGANYSTFGSGKYHESNAGIAFARRFSERLSVGLKLNVFYVFTGGVPSSTALGAGFEAGILYAISDETLLGAHVFNPGRARLHKTGSSFSERVPVLMRMGFSHRLSEAFLITVEAEMELEHSPGLRAGAEYTPADKVYLRAGIGTNPIQNAFGFVCRTEKLTIDLSASLHHVLGYTPQAGIVYHF